MKNWVIRTKRLHNQSKIRRY